MDKRKYELREERQAKNCLVAFGESLAPAKKRYFDEGQKLREQILALPGWRWFKRFRLVLELKRTERGHKLLQMGMDDAIWYRHEIGNRSRPWLIESLQEFVKWIEGVHDGKFALMHDKSQPVKDAIDFLQGKKK